MKITRLIIVSALALPALLFGIAATMSLTSASAVGQDASSDDKGSVEAVEDDMHEFMEYVFQPTYKRLKAAMAVAEKEAASWKSIKSDALILAEGGNLLLGRGSDSDEAAWISTSISVRKYGAQLYRAAKAKNSEEAQKAYAMMINNCNACHDKFAGGEHQLKP